MNAVNKLFRADTHFRTETRMGAAEWGIFALILLAGALTRFVLLDEIPPGLWFDEALYALDGYRASQGEWALFYDKYGHPREPLFPWCLGLAFQLMEPTVLVARSVSALWGTLAVAMFFPVARRVLPERWALAAMAAFAVFRWHVHFSRTIFRAGLASPMMLLAVWMFLRWRERRRVLDAALCGAAMGACLYTYISLRVVPILVTLWIGWLAWKGALSLRREWKQVLVLYGAALVVFAPLGLDYLHNPEHLSGRTGEITMFEKTVQERGPDGEFREVRVAKSAMEAAGGIAENAWVVAKAWFVKGDHVAKHNMPLRPVFDPVTGLLFLAGVLVCLWGMVRYGSPVGLILLSWFGGFAMASVMSFGAPNILRMQGASPVVILLMVLGLRQVVLALPVGRGGVRRLLPVLVLVCFGVVQLWDYFRVFPNDMRVRQEFTADVFYEPARAVDEVASQVDKVYVPAEMAENLQFKFTTVRRRNIIPYTPGEKLPVPGAGERAAWVMTQRSEQLAAEAGQSQEAQVRGMAGSQLREVLKLPVHEEGVLLGWQPWAEVWVR